MSEPLAAGQEEQVRAVMSAIRRQFPANVFSELELRRLAEVAVIASDSVSDVLRARYYRIARAAERLMSTIEELGLEFEEPPPEFSVARRNLEAELRRQEPQSVG